MLDRFATESLVAWYNRLLLREDWARAALAPYANRTARIDAGLVSLFVGVVPGGTLAPGTGTPSVIITLEPQTLANSLFTPAALRSKVKMEGDAEFAQVFTDVLQKLRPDPAEDLSRIIGDAPAERIVGAVSAGFTQLRESAQRAARLGADFLVAENPLLVGAQEWARFLEELNAVQQRLGALEERIGAMDVRTGAHSAAPSGDVPQTGSHD